MSDARINISEFAAGDGFVDFAGGAVKSNVEGCLVAANPKKLSFAVESGVDVQLLILHTEPRQGAVEIELCENARLAVAEIFLCSTFSEVTVRQNAGSSCSYTVAELGGSNVSYTVELNGRNAEWLFGGAFVGTGSDRCAITLNTRHNLPDCKSDSMLKGVVSGRAAGEFDGLVYVAADAQRTDARQQSRNIELGSDAHIVAKPQLEIYADDVKCSHGATVGHRDDEALLYMRQRGLDERDAQRLQIEGFVKDVVLHCPIESVRAAMEAAIDEKLQKL